VKTISPDQFAELLASHDPRREDRFLTLLDAELEGLSVHGKDLSCCVLVRCRITGAVFESCELRRALLIDTKFEQCRFRDCNLYKADLNGAHLVGIEFTGSDMGRCDLSRADLQCADLTGCVLDWAWLIGCDMRDAILEHTSFRGTRIGEAKLYNSRRFHLGPHDQAHVDNVDMSPAGDGSIIVNGDELWPMLDSGPAA
jgi:uncharacterized protein YjbI with pentapeptide repeats